MEQELVFIGGLHRSGTTLLQFLAGAHPRLVPVGEVNELFGRNLTNDQKINEQQCSCGELAKDCKLWGEIIRELRESGNATKLEKYELFLRHFRNVFGDEVIPVDSSKSMETLELLKKVDQLQVRVLFMIRDVRAWTVSLRAPSWANRKKKKRSISSIRSFWKWYRGNSRYMSALQKLEVQWLPVSYEELVLRPEESMQRISDFLGLNFADSMLKYSQGEHHSIFINRMAADQEKMGKIIYDNRWFHETRHWLLPMVLFPNIMKFNAKHVYGYVNDSLDDAKKFNLRK